MTPFETILCARGHQHVAVSSRGARVDAFQNNFSDFKGEKMGRQNAKAVCAAAGAA